MNFKAQKLIYIFVCFYFLIIFKTLSFNVPFDSVGIEKRGSKTFVLHKVDPKETLYSISLRYKSKVELIEAENPEVKSGLKVGIVLRVPFDEKTPSTVVRSGTSTAKTHTVAPGQTLYSIARIYKVKVEDIIKWNNIVNNEISVGQDIYVSAPSANASTAATAEKPKDEANSEDAGDVPNFRYDAKGNKVHITQPGQTLFSLSRIYDVSVEDIKNWNNLNRNEISTGQEIIVERPKQKEIAATNEKVKVDSNRNEEASVVFPSRDTAKSTPHSRSEQSRSSSNPTSPTSGQTSNSTSFNKVIDRGLAELIEGSEDNPKFLALHKTASVGTIIQVKNELNNLYIFARVIGKLPETTSNDKLIIKLSKKAYDKLAAVDRRFPVEVSYVPNN